MSQIQAEQLYQLLQNHRSPLSQENICTQLGISAATFKRALKILRTQMGITVYSPMHGGYRIDAKDKKQIQINRHWFSPEEITALAQGYRLLDTLSKTAYLSRLIAPVLDKITHIVKLDFGNPTSYIQIISPHERQNNGQHLPELIQALQAKQQLKIHYDARSSGPSTRNISPQKLIRYRENWYLIGYCHSRNALRTFANERILSIQPCAQAAHNIAPTELKTFIESVYGIFGGPKKYSAKITFMPTIAPWIKDEIWHPQQTLTELQNGAIQLQLPIGENPSEITMDLLRYAKHIQDIAPKKLKQQYIQDLKQALQQIEPNAAMPPENKTNGKQGSKTEPKKE